MLYWRHCQLFSLGIHNAAALVCVVFTHPYQLLVICKRIIESRLERSDALRDLRLDLNLALY